MGKGTGMRTTLSALAACAALVSSAETFRGRESWGCIKAHPAVVNPVVPATDAANLMSLRGEWDFVTNKFSNGRHDLWASAADGVSRVWRNASALRKIQVPGCWEAQGVGSTEMSRPWVCQWDCSPKPIRHAFWGEGWYRKRVTIPETWRGRRVWLKMSTVGTEGWFWVNGNRVAHVAFYCGSAKYDVTDFVKFGETNVIVAEVINTGTSRMGGFASMNYWGGILRDVELECTPDVFIDDAWVRGLFDGRKAEVKVKVDGEGWRENLALRATVEGEKTELKISSPSTFTLEIPLPSFRPWSPEHPNLYTARVELVEGGRVVQTRHERFGVRKLEVRGREFYLNGRPLFLRGAGWHSLFPMEGAPPADRDLYRRLAGKIKAAGFNFCRFHSSSRPPELFEACDEVGIMLQPELPYYADVPASGQMFDPFADAEELYLNYRRHPSFAVYSGGNEGWFGPAASKLIYEEVKARDPDRLMISQDQMLNKRSNKAGTSDYQGGPLNVWARGTVNPNTPFVCHEYLNLSVKLDSRLSGKFTGVWMPPTSREARAKWLANFGLDLEYGDSLQDAQAVMQKVWRKYGFESARIDPYCDGYSYWSLQDACSPNGEAYSGQALFDPFWGEKPHGDTAESVAVYNSASCLLLDTDPRLRDEAEEKKRKGLEMFLTDFATNRVRCAGESIKAHFFLAHYGEAPFSRARLEWRLVSGGRVLAGGARDVGDQSLGAVREIADFDVRVPEVSAPCCASLEATLVSADGAKVANSWDWWLFPARTKLDGRRVFVAEPFRRALSSRFTAFAQSADAAEVVVAPPESPEAEAARKAGKRLISIAGIAEPVRITLGWWWMGKQMGAVFRDHSALGRLPREEFLSPLYFRIMRDGGAKLSADSRKDELIVYGEGGEACYSYLAERRHPSGSIEYRVDGIDLLADVPEADAILAGLLEARR